MEQFETVGYFINANGDKSTDLMFANPQFNDDVVVPKKPQRGYIHFYKANYKAESKADPSLKVVEIAKILGEKWSNLSSEERRPYYKMTEDDQLRHDQEMQELLTKGYFMTTLQVKSTDIQVKKKKAAAN